jgi:hypothetical protein
LWQGDMGLILALIKIVEDRLNVEDIYKGHVRAILLVEDNVQFYSAYLTSHHVPAICFRDEKSSIFLSYTNLFTS